MSEIVCPRLNNIYSIDALFEQVKDISYLEKVLIDFRNVDWVTPSGCVNLVLITDHLINSGVSVEIINLTDQIHAYLKRIDYFKCFEGQLLEPYDDSYTTVFGRANASDNLMEIWKIPYDLSNNATILSLLLPNVARVLDSSFAEEMKTLDKILTMVSEIGSNVAHSLSLGYCTVQTYDKHNRAKIHIAIGDFGIGIKDSLQPVKFSKDIEYIDYALQSGISSKEGVRGLGLAEVIKSVKNLCGEFTLRSGTASATIKGDVMTTKENLIDIPGTQVEIILRK